MNEALSARGEDLFIIGGGNSAGQAAVFFSQYAKSVTIVVRGRSLTESMSQYLIEQIAAIPNVSVKTGTQVTAASGSGHLESITVQCDGPGGKSEQTLAANSLFVFIGAVPQTDWLGTALSRDEFGFIYTGPDLPHDGGRIPGWPLERDPFLLETNVPGIFSAGDVRHQSVKRVASAVGEGSIAVQFTHRYLAETLMGATSDGKRAMDGSGGGAARG